MVGKCSANVFAGSRPAAAGRDYRSKDAAPLDVVLLFVRQQAELQKQFATLVARLAPAGMLWVAWPKKASKVPTGLTFETVHQIGLAAGLVDTKICAINEVWPGLRFVIRVKDRPR